MTLTEVGFCTAAGPVVALVGTDCGYCQDDRYTTVIPEEWSGRTEADRVPPLRRGHRDWLLARHAAN